MGGWGRDGPMSTHLVFSLVGPDRTGLVERLTEVVARHGGNLEDARMSVLGGEFAVIMLVGLEAEERMALEEDLRTVAQELNLLMLSKETGDRLATHAGTPFTVSVHGADHEGIVHPITHVLASRGATIVDLKSFVTAAPVTGTDLFSMTMQIMAPAAVTLAELDRHLQEIAHRLNVDVGVVAGHPAPDAHSACAR